MMLIPAAFASSEHSSVVVPPEPFCDEHRLFRAVALNHGRVRLEASGGITLDNVRAVAETGVDEISIGALTHSARSLDVSLEVS